MEAILAVLDPRRSRSRSPTSGTTSRPENKILLSVQASTLKPDTPNSQTFLDTEFPPAQLAKALKAAAAATDSAKGRNNGAVVTVHLPVTPVVVKSTVTLPSNVTVSGSTKDLDCSSIVLQGNGALVCQNGLFSLENVRVINSRSKSKSQSPAISVASGASLRISECVFDAATGGEDSLAAGNCPLGFLVKGNLEIVNSSLTDWRMEFEGSGSSKLVTTKVNRSSSSGGKECAISMFSGENSLLLESTEIQGFSVGVLFESKSQTAQLAIHKSTIQSEQQSLVLVGGNSKITESTFSRVEARDKATVNMEDSKITNSDGSFASQLAYLDVNGATVDLSKVEIIGNGTSGIGISVKGSGAKFGMEAIEEDTYNVKFKDLTISDCQKGLLVESQGCVDGNHMYLKSNSDVGIESNGLDNVVKIDEGEIEGSAIGVLAVEAEYFWLSKIKITGFSTLGISVTRSSVDLEHVNVKSVNPGVPGMKVVFMDGFQSRVIGQSCKFQDCNYGVHVMQAQVSNEIKQQHLMKSTRSAKGALVMGYDEFSASSSSKPSKCELENCVFIGCNTGFMVDAARATLRGCSFVMNLKHSVFIKNQVVKQGFQLGRESRFKIRWQNYVEPKLDNGAQLSNNSQLLTNATKEKAFCGSADFEPIMYLPILTERIRQARNLFRSKDDRNVHKARVIMMSVHHMLTLLKKLPQRLLNKEMIEDPDLGMFAATFKMSVKPKTGSARNTLVLMEDLFKSWKSLTRTRLFDSALAALDEAFDRKQVDEDLYDEWVTPLEEMQRVCFVKSKFNRRRDYLLTTAKNNPVSTWYFLGKEDASTDEGKRLRQEVLEFLARDDTVPDATAVKINAFHSSWVGQWAVHMLGNEFAKAPIPTDYPLRQAWADALLDRRQPRRVLDAYGQNTGYATSMDHLMIFEALKQTENGGQRLSAPQQEQLNKLFSGQGLDGAMRAAARLFKTEGALPGFLRRIADEEEDADKLLTLLSSVNDEHSGLSQEKKRKVTLAVMSHFFNPDETTEPKISEREDGSPWVTCPSCWSQKLQPWNEISLKGCNGDHRFCKNCMRSSMKVVLANQWGVCPGFNGDEACTTLASRREMCLAEMSEEVIYNIIEKRVEKRLKETPDWRPCDAPGCIGGRSSTHKLYYECRLCKKMVTLDKGMSDPTVAKKVLKGFDASTIARGKGLFRECYYCAVVYEKGDACSTITCSHCNKQFNMSFGPEQLTHRFDEEGVGPQRYVPKKEGVLFKQGVFKDGKGKALKLGTLLTPKQATEVVRRCKIALRKFD